MADAPKDTGEPRFPFTPEDAMAFMQRMWNPFGVAFPGFGAPVAGAAASPGAPPFASPAMMFAALDPGEVDRKIGELRIIEGWLQMSLGMMQMSIKTLELQKASLEAMRGTQAAPPEDKARRG